MRKQLEDLRLAADDFFRLAGVWALLGSAVTTFLLSLGVTVAAYLRGVRGVSLAFAGGMAAGTFIVLLLICAVWVMHRRRLRAELFRRTTPSGRRGFLSQKKHQRVALAEVTQVFHRMAADMDVFTAAIHRGNIIMHAIRWTPDAIRDLVAEKVADYVARRMDANAQRRELTNQALSDASTRLIESQSAFLTWAVANNSDLSELKQLRDAIVIFRASTLSGKASQVNFRKILAEGDVATDALVASSDRLASGVDHSISVLDRLEAHGEWVMTLLDTKLGGAH